MINISSRREVFWDNYLIDTQKTTVTQQVNAPIKKGECFLFDQALEKNSISYPCVLKDEKGYRMYYSPWSWGEKEPYITIAVIESTDGIHWFRPELNILPHPELPQNNYVLENIIDSAFVFLDTNPACPKDERYKAVGLAIGEVDGKSVRGLWAWYSDDGYHFSLSHLLNADGQFDSLNTVFWKDGEYWCYFRGFHNIVPGDDIISHATRDIRVMHSADFTNWSPVKQITYEDSYDLAMYTNNAIPYERAPHLTIAFPTRYFERKGYTQNLQQMGSYPLKMKAIERCEFQYDKDRVALVNTDCVFMMSRDGETFKRYNEAFMTPGIENADNWIYGDCYPAYNLVDSGHGSYYLYDMGCTMSENQPKPLVYYEIRKDGFACVKAGETEQVLVTKPLTFEGNDLYLNFSTSAFGYLYVDLLDEEGNELDGKHSFEIYGDTLDRKVLFDDDSCFAAYAGCPVRLRFRMLDAKLYSFQFR